MHGRELSQPIQLSTYMTNLDRFLISRRSRRIGKAAYIDRHIKNDNCICLFHQLFIGTVSLKVVSYEFDVSPLLTYLLIYKSKSFHNQILIKHHFE